MNFKTNYQSFNDRHIVKELALNKALDFNGQKLTSNSCNIDEHPKEAIRANTVEELLEMAQKIEDYILK